MTRYIVVVAWVLVFVGLAKVEPARAQPCTPSLSGEFAGDPLDFAPSAVNAFIDFNDGTGFKTYACGSFRTAGGVPANTVARWNGTEWQAVGSGPSGSAPVGTGKCFAIFNNTLYMGGTFGGGDLGVACVYRWTGSAWIPLLDGPRGASVNAMTVWNDGTGNALYAVGSFIRVGPSAIIRAVVKFNGSAWSQLGNGISAPGANIGNAVIGYDDGLGPALYVGGQFGSTSSSLLARWDRTSWNVNAGPSAGIGSAITAFHVFADAQGTALWAAAAPLSLGSPLLYRYGTSRSWMQISIPSIDTPSQAFSLASYNDGTGNALYLGGQFFVPSAAGGGARSLIRYNGTTWSAVGSDGANIFGPTTALSVRTGTRVGLLAGGIFQIGSQPINSVALWNGTAWNSLGSGLTNPGVRDIAFVPDTSAEGLHAVGGFLGTRGTPGSAFNHAARWNGSAWQTLAGGINGARYLTTVGNVLYAGGSVSIPGQTSLGSVAAWDGAAWSLVPGIPVNQPVSAVCAFDDGTQQLLCVGLRGTGGQSLVQVLRNGVWNQLGAPFAFNSTIVGLKQLSDGSLYAMGIALQGTDGIPGVRTVAKWDGVQWTMLPSGPMGIVFDAEVFDGSLYAVGQMFYTDATFVTRPATIAKLTNGVWTYPTSDSSGSPKSIVQWNDGSGDAIYLAGEFSDAARGIANFARLRNGNIEPYAGGTNAPVWVLRVHENALYAGGVFSTVGGQPAPGIAKFFGCPPCVADFDNGGGFGTRDGGVTIDDLLYYIRAWEGDDPRADVDDGTGTGTPDGGLTIDDLIYYLRRYEAGC